MSIVTRVFTVLTLIFSVFFLAHVQQLYHVQENFKAELILSEENLKRAKEELKLTQKDSQSIINSLKQQLTEKDHRSRIHIDQIADKDRQVAQLEADLRDLQNKYKDASDQLTNSLASTSQIQSRIQELETQTEMARRSNDALQEQLELSQDNASHQEHLKITYRDQVNTLKSQVEEKDDELYVANIKIQSYEDRYGPMDPLSAIPVIKGKVRGVDGDQEIIIVNRGSDHQVKPGYIFNIRHQNSFIGKARVDTVNTDSCVAIIMKEFLKGEVKAHDDVSTR